MIAVWILAALIGLLLFLLLVSLVRTLLIPSRRSTYVPAPDPERAELYAGKLSRMVRCETVSVPGEISGRSSLRFTGSLKACFPGSMRSLKKRRSMETCCFSGREKVTAGLWSS